MREILFRGKRIDNGEWVEGYYCGKVNKTIFSPAEDSAQIIDKDLYWHELTPETVGQYTGLTDKNGVKIFEGDVVRLVYNYDEHIYQVVYDVSELDFKATNGKEEYRTNYQYLTCCDEVEVIGNIHDNPELAEGLL